MFLRTLHLTNSYHDHSGGIRTTFQAMLHAANRRGMRLSLVVPSTTDRIEEAGDHGRIYHVRAPRSPLIDHRYRVLTPHRVYLPQSAVWPILEQEKPDLISITDKFILPYLGGLVRRDWCPLTFRPTLIGMSCERLDDNVRIHLSPSPFWQSLTRWYLGLVYIPQFDALIANSDYTASELVTATTARHWRPIEIVAPGVDVDTFHPRHRSPTARSELCRKLKLPTTARLLLYAGRVSPEKNPMLLLETLERLLRQGMEDYRLLVVGGGPSCKLMEEQARVKLPGRVIFQEHLCEREQLAGLYANSDAFLHPNPREPFGIGPLEAMASHLPVVAPNRGGVLTYANSSNSWLAPPHPERFAQAVSRVFENFAERDRRVLAARKTAEDFRWEESTSRLFELFEQLHFWRLALAGNRASIPVSASTGNDCRAALLTAAMVTKSKRGQ
jgi:alpha-1,6-mannosyltransferase